MSDELTIQMRVHEVFESMVELHAHKDAVVCAGERISYETLNVRANRLAHFLIEQGVEHEEPVGVAFEKSCDLIVAVLGILKSGAAYVPLGENLPVSQLRSILEDVKCRRVVVQSGHLEDLWTDSEERFMLRDSDGFAGTNPVVAGGAGDLAYILYTSGSTGKPKGVQIEHAGIVRLVQGQDYLPFGPDLNYLFLGPISFDISTLGMFVPLMIGSTMVIEPALIPDAAALCELVRTEKVRASCVIFGMFASLFEARPEIFEPMSTVLVGGEAVSSVVIQQAMERLPGTRFVNVYGPTETTVLGTSFSIMADLSGDLATVPIGKPLAGMTHVVVDEQLKPVAPGELGELCMMGVGLARGYLNSPELTAEKFPTIQFGDGHKERVYRTGDRVYELPDGNIVFDGRIDEQVKVRGFRIELGAIEAAIEQIESITRASVVVTGVGDAAKIHARVISASFDLENTLAELTRKLPEYMVPDEVVCVDALPITANGKVDKRALVELVESEQGERSCVAYVEPETHTQRLLCSIWEELLGVDRVGIDDSFLDLGGHSLRAVVMCSRGRDRLGVDLPVSVVFAERTVRGLGAWIDDPHRAKKTPGEIPVIDRSGPIPVSFNQERLWMLDQINPGDPSYNIAIRIVFNGDLDENAIRAAWSALHRRHEVLRTRIVEAEQVILGVDEVEPVFRWDESSSEAECRAAQAREFSRVFDFSEAPLARLCAFKLGPERSLLAVTMHHIISDAWSCEVLRRELQALYEAYLDGRDANLDELAIQYADFASWQREITKTPEYHKDLAYWVDRFEGTKVVELPADRPRRDQLGNQGARVRMDLPRAVVDRIREMSSSGGVTTNTVLLAAFTAWLHRLVGDEDIVVGMPIASRERSEFEGLIGFFMETIAVRVPVKDGDSFGALLQRTSDEFWASMDHGRVPFQHVIAAVHEHATIGRNPLFEVFFNYIAIKMRGGDGDDSRFVFDEQEVDNRTAKFDLTCYVFDDEDSISVVFNYRSAIFTDDTAERFLQQFITVIASALESPDQRVSEIQILSDNETELWDRARCGSPIGDFHAENIVEAFDRRALDVPKQVAVSSVLGSLCYQELAAWSHGACAHMQELGVQSGDRVVVGMRDPRLMAAGILGALRAGAMYVPIDLAWPIARIEQVIALASARAVIVDDEVGARVSANTVSPSNWSRCTELVDPAPIRGEDDAYMLFTSGSTGVPKGVVQTHRGVIEHNRVFADSMDLTVGDRVLMTSSQAFDAAPMDMYSAWLTGAAWCPFDLQHGSAAKLAAFICEHKVTVLHAAPSVLRWFAGTNPNPEQLASVRMVVLGGEQARSTDVDSVRSLFPNCVRMINGLGLTESSVSLQHGVDLRDENICYSGALPIGRATAGMRVRLVDDLGNETSLFGEIELESTRIAAGYWNPDTQTTEPVGVGCEDGRVRFRTGDLAMMRADGALVSRGRVDGQVQVHGCRVEIGEVEAVVRELDAVGDAAIVARRGEDGSDVLCAFVVFEPEATSQISTLRSQMGSRVPGYMVPSEWHVVEKIPRVGGGKVDLMKIRSLAEGCLGWDAEEDTAPMDATAQAIAEIFQEVLGCEEVHGASDFFLLGGSSLKAIRVFSMLRERFGTSLPVATMFQSPTPNALSALIGSEHSDIGHGIFIPMRDGDQNQRVYLLPGNGGHPLGFGAMLSHLGTAGAYIGVQLPGLDGEMAIIESIEDLASHLIAEMDIAVDGAAWPMIGYSFGGALAFEMALQLQERGHRPGALILLDSHSLEGLPKKSRFGTLCEHALAVLGKGEDNGVRYLTKKFRGSVVTAHTPMTKKTGNPMIDRMIQINRRAVAKYVPGNTYEGEVVLVRAKQPAWLRFHRDDGMNGWGRWTCPGKVRVYDLDAEHMKLLHADSAPALAQIIEKALFPKF